MLSAHSSSNGFRVQPAADRNARARQARDARVVGGAREPRCSRSPSRAAPSSSSTRTARQRRGRQGQGLGALRPGGWQQRSEAVCTCSRSDNQLQGGNVLLACGWSDGTVMVWSRRTAAAGGGQEHSGQPISFVRFARRLAALGRPAAGERGAAERVRCRCVGKVDSRAASTRSARTGRQPAPSRRRLRTASRRRSWDVGVRGGGPATSVLAARRASSAWALARPLLHHPLHRPPPRRAALHE